MDSLFSSFRFFTDQPWAIPAIGLLVASIAFLVGRRWLVPRPIPEPELSPEEAASQYLSSKLQLSQSDRRSCPRRKGGNRIEVDLTDDAKESQLLGWVIDRSMGGLCLYVEKPLSAGTILNVRPRNAPKTSPWIPIEIRSCRPDGNEWEVGCCFLKPPHWNDLMLFG
jgi:hypothetical protein